VSAVSKTKGCKGSNVFPQTAQGVAKCREPCFRGLGRFLFALGINWGGYLLFRSEVLVG